MTDLQQLNKDMVNDIKESKTGRSHGLNVFIQAIREAQEVNELIASTDPNKIARIEKYVTVYFTWVTDNRLMAHIITDTDTDNPRLARLRIPEARYRLYANYKDGYQVNGGQHNKPFHILEAMVDQAKKHTNVNSPLVTHMALPFGSALSGITSWQDYIKSEVIS